MEQIERTVQDVIDGKLNALEAYVSLKQIKSSVDAALEQIKSEAIEEHEKHGEKEVNIQGMKVSVTRGGRYSYSKSQSWSELNTKRKSLEKAMQTAYKTGEEMYDGNGEQIEPADYIPNNESIKVV